MLQVYIYIYKVRSFGEHKAHIVNTVWTKYKLCAAMHVYMWICVCVRNYLLKTSHWYSPYHLLDNAVFTAASSWFRGSLTEIEYKQINTAQRIFFFTRNEMIVASKYITEMLTLYLIVKQSLHISASTVFGVLFP